MLEDGQQMIPYSGEDECCSHLIKRYVDSGSEKDGPNCDAD